MKLFSIYYIFLDKHPKPSYVHLPPVMEYNVHRKLIRLTIEISQAFDWVDLLCKLKNNLNVTTWIREPALFFFLNFIISLSLKPSSDSSSFNILSVQREVPVFLRDILCVLVPFNRSWALLKPWIFFFNHWCVIVICHLNFSVSHEQCAFFFLCWKV